jgi:nucleotide-binding universal stress UspA family protein
MGGIDMFKRNIVSTDLSQAAYALVNCLGGLKSYEAEKCLLLQCLSLQEAASLSFAYSSSVIEESLRIQKEILEKQGYEVETRIVPGVTKHEVSRIAEEEDYSLIVVGAQLESLTKEIFFNGLAYEIIYHAMKPILIIRLKDDPSEGLSCISSTGCDINNNILFATDFSDNADNAFEYVKGMVSDGAKKVTLLHVQDKNHISPYLEDRLEAFNQIDRVRLQNLKSILEECGNAEIETLLRYGSPTIEIIDTVRERNIQLVVMGTQGRGIIKELFLGSVSHNISRHCPASVLLIPSKREK